MDTVKRLLNILRSKMAPDYEPDGKTYESFQSEPPPKQTETEQERKEKHYYQNLETPYGADFATIKSNYRKLLKQYHPDRYNQDDDKRRVAEEVTEKLNEAYQYFKAKNK